MNICNQYQRLSVYFSKVFKLISWNWRDRFERLFITRVEGNLATMKAKPFVYKSCGFNNGTGRKEHEQKRLENPKIKGKRRRNKEELCINPSKPPLFRLRSIKIKKMNKLRMVGGWGEMRASESRYVRMWNGASEKRRIIVIVIEWF